VTGPVKLVEALLCCARPPAWRNLLQSFVDSARQRLTTGCRSRSLALEPEWSGDGPAALAYRGVVLVSLCRSAPSMAGGNQSGAGLQGYVGRPCPGGRSILLRSTSPDDIYRRQVSNVPAGNLECLIYCQQMRRSAVRRPSSRTIPPVYPHAGAPSVDKGGALITV
jgi:hypothetical protein